MNETIQHIYYKDLKDDHNILLEIYLKPTITIWVFLIGSIVLILLSRNVQGLIVGLIFAIMPLYNIIFVKNRKVVEMHKQYMIVDDQMNNDMCYVIDYDQIKSYTRQQLNSSFVYVLYLCNDDQIQIPTADSRLNRYLHKIMPEKDEFTKWKNEFNNRMNKRHNK